MHNGLFSSVQHIGLTLLVDVYITAIQGKNTALLFPPLEEMALSGWVCLVTGASRGIGKGIALQLSEAGATVYITGRQEKTLKQTAAEVDISLKSYFHN